MKLKKNFFEFYLIIKYDFSLNRDVYQQFSRIERSKARRMRSHNAPGSRMFVRVTIWTVTAVVAMAMAVIYHTYNDGFELDGWSPFS